MDVFVCTDRENHLGFGNSQNEEDSKKYGKKRSKRVVYMAMDQKIQ